MTEHKATPHRANPEVWAAVERWSKNDMETSNCILELRDRVEALEAAAKPAEFNYEEKLDSSNPPKSSDSLVERVADVIYSNATGGFQEARAAIHAVAKWLDQQKLHVSAGRLRREAQ